MDTQRHSLVLHTHLLRMTALTQRAVDHSVKAYELNSPEFTRKALEAAKELHAIELSIADRGRTLLAAGRLMDSTSRPGSCSLRIYSALRITHAAATEIARNTRLKISKGHVSISAPTAEMAGLVNSLVRLNTVAVFNRQAHHAMTVLQAERARRKHDVWRHRIHDDPQELAIFRCLEQIAEQACEIADALTQLLKSQHAGFSQRDRGSFVVGRSVATLSEPVCFKNLSSFAARSRLSD
jgi:phosphate uptake regulator